MARSEGRRERTVCESCELPYYADGDGCPYCGATTGEVADASTDVAPGEDDEFVFGDAESGAESTADGDRADRDDGALARFKNALGL